MATAEERNWPEAALRIEVKFVAVDGGFRIAQLFEQTGLTHGRSEYCGHSPGVFSSWTVEG